MSGKWGLFYLFHIKSSLLVSWIYHFCFEILYTFALGIIVNNISIHFIIILLQTYTIMIPRLTILRATMVSSLTV